jgi:hypothetical protein
VIGKDTGILIYAAQTGCWAATSNLYLFSAQQLELLDSEWAHATIAAKKGRCQCINDRQ